MAKGYAVGYFARKHEITVGKAEELIIGYGTSREKLDAAVGKLNEADRPLRLWRQAAA